MLRLVALVVAGIALGGCIGHRAHRLTLAGSHEAIDRLADAADACGLRGYVIAYPPADCADCAGQMYMAMRQTRPSTEQGQAGQCLQQWWRAHPELNIRLVERSGEW